MQAKRTSSTSKTPALSKVTWSSWASSPKPGMRLANSTTPRIAGENRFEKSFNSSCCPVTGRGLGFNGQACTWKRKNGWMSKGTTINCYYLIYRGLDSGGDASRATTLLKMTIHNMDKTILIRETYRVLNGLHHRARAEHNGV